VRKLLKSKWFIVLVTVLILIVVIFIGIIPGSPLRNISKPVTSLVSPIQGWVKSAGDTLTDFKAAIFDGVAIREENESLKEEMAQLQYELTQNEEAAIRYEELKDALHIKDAFSNYEIFGASILSREADEWFSVIRVGCGSSDGVDLDVFESYAVVDVEMNLVGRVIETGNDESKILPLLHEGFSVSCKVNEVNGATMVVSGDSELKKSNLCLVTGISADMVIEPGDEIVTTGDGGLFPEGIPVGTIVSVDYSNPMSVTATLEPYSDIGSLKDVFIMVPTEEYLEAEAEAAEETAETEEAQ